MIAEHLHVKLPCAAAERAVCVEFTAARVVCAFRERLCEHPLAQQTAMSEDEFSIFGKAMADLNSLPEMILELGYPTGLQRVPIIVVHSPNV